MGDVTGVGGNGVAEPGSGGRLTTMVTNAQGVGEHVTPVYRPRWRYCFFEG